VTPLPQAALSHRCERQEVQPCAQVSLGESHDQHASTQHITTRFIARVGRMIWRQLGRLYRCSGGDLRLDAWFTCRSCETAASPTRVMSQALVNVDGSAIAITNRKHTFRC